MPGRGAWSENGETGVRGRGGETTFTTARSATSITTGWVDSVCRCHEDSIGLGRDEEEAAAGRERERDEQSRAGPLGGVKRLTVCYHGNATPLRQEESLNPARYGPCRLSFSPSFGTPHQRRSLVSPRKSKGRRATTREVLPAGGEDGAWMGDGGDRITPLTLFLHRSVFTERFRYTGSPRKSYLPSPPSPPRVKSSKSRRIFF